jgi:hypothetical protein
MQNIKSRKILLLNLWRANHTEGWKFFVDRQPLNVELRPLFLNLQGTQNSFSFTNIFAVFNAHNNGINNLSVSLSFRQVLATHLSPVNLSPVDYLEAVCIVNLNFLGNIGTLYNSSIVPMSRLNKIDTFIEAVILIHD